jgi:hypothetical protein
LLEATVFWNDSFSLFDDLYHRQPKNARRTFLPSRVALGRASSPGRLYRGRCNGNRRADRCVMQWTGNEFVVVTMVTLSYGKKKYGGKTQLEVLTVL